MLANAVSGANQPNMDKRTLELLPGNRGGAPSWLHLVGRHCVFGESGGPLNSELAPSL
jgi:hypothetical protein